jgi:site-specific recombinase XerD
LLPLAELNESWLAELRAARKSDATIKVYRDAWAAYVMFCDTNGRSLALAKPDVLAFITDQTARCSAPTASLRLTALKVFARWLEAEEGFDAAPMLSVTAPKIDERVVDHLTDAQVRALVAACRGTELRDLRDKALVSMFAETGLRSSEMLSLTIDDVSINQCTAVVRKDKGGAGRRVKFSPTTAVLIDRYLRARRRAGHHPSAHGGRLWLSSRGPLSYRGLAEALRARAVAAGIGSFHLHRLRHTTAVRWLAAGGSETGLMAQAGWRSRTMIDRYIKSAREDLAADEFDRLNLGLGEL